MEPTQPDAPELPTIEQDIDVRPFEFQSHDWQQRGYSIVCGSCPGVSAHGHNIPIGSMLVGSRGNWKLVAEGGRMKQ